MKLNKLYTYFFSTVLLIIAISQIYTVYFSVDNTFNTEIENHLKSIVEIKSERINDYLSERKRDTLVLSNSKELINLLKTNLTINQEISNKNIFNQLDILSKQINIYLKKYPDLTFQDLQKNDEFKNLFVKTIGITGTSIIFDIKTQNIIQSSNPKHLTQKFNEINNGFYNTIIDTQVKTSDGFSIGISAIAYKNEFKIIANTSFNEKQSLNRFSKIGNYENIILISPDNYIIYQSNENSELSSNLNNSNIPTSLIFKTIYNLSNQLNSEKIIILGPYYNTDNIDSKLVISFGTPIFDNNIFLGTLILTSTTDKINKIVIEENKLGKTGETYLINNNEYLISPLQNLNVDILVQKIQTTNSKDCIQKNQNNKLSYYENLNGVQVLGNYGFIDETSWCLISEISYNEIFNAPKSQQLSKDLAFIIILTIILLININLLKNSLKKYSINIKYSVSKSKLYLKLGIFIYILSKFLYLLETQLYTINTINTKIIYLLILELIGIILIFYSIINFRGDKE